MATELGLDELRAHSLTTIGMTKSDAGDPSGVADMEHALEIALAVDSPIAGTIVNNLAVYATYAGDFPRTDELYVEALRLAERYGDASTVRFIHGNLVWLDFMLGRWNRALESADAFIAECEAGSPHVQEDQVRETRAAISIARGDRDRALQDQQRALELANVRLDPFQQLASLASTAVVHAELGRLEDARSLAAQVPPLAREVGLHGSLTRLALFADELGIGDDLRAVALTTAAPRVSAWTQPGGLIERILAGELNVAADMAGSAGNPTIEANIRKHAGFRMLAAGRTADAQVELERALAFYRSVDASFYVEQIESARAGAQSESA